MNTYEVTIKIPNRDAFFDFIEKVGPNAGEMTINVTKVIKDLPISEKSPYRKTVVKQTRPLRGSKVNDTILNELSAGPRTVKDLKGALEANHLSAGSLSTGIAALTKAGQIQRVTEGVYGLTELNQAAE
jgi:hypothetical protein